MGRLCARELLEELANFNISLNVYSFNHSFARYSHFRKEDVLKKRLIVTALLCFSISVILYALRVDA